MNGGTPTGWPFIQMTMQRWMQTGHYGRHPVGGMSLSRYDDHYELKHSHTGLVSNKASIVIILF